MGTSEVLSFDFLVVGAGVAGLRAAIELGRHGTVLVVAKDSLEESNSTYAQGGIAAALSDDDDIGLHEADTLAAGDGLCRAEAVRLLVGRAPDAISELVEWGASFDSSNGAFAFAREGAHTRNRVLHAGGDSTGREIARVLKEQAHRCPHVTLLPFTHAVNVLLHDGEARGAVLTNMDRAAVVAVHCRAILLASGGLGHLYERTTNPDVATGDGVAMGLRAGCAIQDLEFVQFHPTALSLPDAPSFLLSEALRGEGAILRNRAGERFLKRHDPRGELAPRDVVSRAIAMEMRADGSGQVFLDITHLPADSIRGRFPTIYRTCLQHGFDMGSSPVPVAPAAHYAMGGVATDLTGATTVPRLYAAGEAACTGVHGANRLASNSLLEALVFGAAAAQAMCGATSARSTGGRAPEFQDALLDEHELRHRMWAHCGIARNREDLDSLSSWLASVRRVPAAVSTAALRRSNLLEVASVLTQAAIAREESRGAHYRTDFPRQHEEPALHSEVRHNRRVEFVP